MTIDYKAENARTKEKLNDMRDDENENKDNSATQMIWGTMFKTRTKTT